MQSIRSEVGAVGPTWRAELVEPHLPKQILVSQGLEDRPEQTLGQIDLAADPVGELDVEPVAWTRLNVACGTAASE